MSFCSWPNHTRYIILTFRYVSIKGIPVLPLFFLLFEISWKKAIALNKCWNILQDTYNEFYSCFSIPLDYRCGHYSPLRTLHWDAFCPFCLICRHKCPIFWLKFCDRGLFPQQNHRLLQYIDARIRQTFASVADSTPIFVEKSTRNWKGLKMIIACQFVLTVVYLTWCIFLVFFTVIWVHFSDTNVYILIFLYEIF